jgi:hypothetical protein
MISNIFVTIDVHMLPHILLIHLLCADVHGRYGMFLAHAQTTLG